MFVKQLTEAELNEYERQLQGTIDSVKNLAGSDEGTNAIIKTCIDGCQDLQFAVTRQIGSFHLEESKPTPPDPD